jgi:hypothetical protein
MPGIHRERYFTIAPLARDIRADFIEILIDFPCFAGL